MTSGMRNKAIDLEAVKKKNIIALRGGIHPKPSPHGYLQILKKIKCKTITNFT